MFGEYLKKTKKINKCLDIESKSGQLGIEPKDTESKASLFCLLLLIFFIAMVTM